MKAERRDGPPCSVSPISSPPRASRHSLQDKRWPGVSVGLGSASGLSRVEGFVTRVGSIWGTSAGNRAPVPPARLPCAGGLVCRLTALGRGANNSAASSVPETARQNPAAEARTVLTPAARCEVQGWGARAQSQHGTAVGGHWALRLLCPPHTGQLSSHTQLSLRPSGPVSELRQYRVSGAPVLHSLPPRPPPPPGITLRHLLH